MKNRLFLFFWAASMFFPGPASGQEKAFFGGEGQKRIKSIADNSLIYNVLKNSTDSLSRALAAQPESWGIQIIYTTVKKKGKRSSQFKDHHFSVNPDSYFYPASTVKFPIAILALQRLRELSIPGLDRNSTFLTGRDRDLQTEVYNDPTTSDGRPTIAHYQ
jgi:hypothetical protein